MSDARWLAPKEFAAHLGVHLITVRRWIARAEPSIEVLRVGGIVRVRLRATSCNATLSVRSQETHAHS